jgi:Spy/CpxP family protein refolding chaperone
MNSRTRNTAVLAATLAAITLSAPVPAEDDNMPMMQHNRPGMMAGGMGMMEGRGMAMGMATMHALDLDRDQVRKMTQIHKELAQKHAGMRAEIQELQWELSQEMAKEKPSAKRVGNLYEQIFKQRRQLIQDRVEARNNMMDALSDNQRQQWRRMMENRRQMRMGPGMPRDAE